MDIDYSILEEIESRYLSLYPYKEEEISKRIILMAETFTIFSSGDREKFIHFLFSIRSYNIVDFEVVIGLLFNSYFLSTVVVKRKFGELLVSLIPKSFAWKFVLLSMSDYDNGCKAYLEVLLENKILTEANSQELLYLVISPDNSLFFSKEFVDRCLGYLQVNASEINRDSKELTIKEEILFIIPPHMKRKGFLQPPIDAINAASILLEDGYEAKILDLRTASIPLDVYQIESKVIFICTCPYDLMQNYPVDYKYEHTICLINYLVDRLTAAKIFAYGPYFAINKGAIQKLVSSQVELIEEEIERVVLSAVHRHIEHESKISARNRFSVYDLIDFSRYYSDSNSDSGRISPWCAVLANRGCPYKCAFCYLFFGHSLRLRDSQEVVLELRELEKKGVREVFFIDSSFTANKKWVVQFCNCYKKEGLTIKWQIETRVDCLDENTIISLKTHGCSKIWLGIESLSDTMLQLAEKRLTVSRIVDQISLLRRHKLPIGAFFIAGLPGETPNGFNNLLDTISLLGIQDSQLVMFVPRKGTPFYDRALKQFPFLDEDFRYLQIVRGIVNNKVKRSELNEAIVNFYRNT